MRKKKEKRKENVKKVWRNSDRGEKTEKETQRGRNEGGTKVGREKDGGKEGRDIKEGMKE